MAELMDLNLSEKLIQYSFRFLVKVAHSYYHFDRLSKTTKVRRQSENKKNLRFFVSSKGDLLSYLKFGEGKKKIVLIGGLALSWRVWEPQIEYFKRDQNLFKDYEVLVFDNIGIGKSSVRIGLRHSIHELTGALYELLLFLGWREFSVCGISMGGIISQNLLYLTYQKNKQILAIPKSLTFSPSNKRNVENVMRIKSIILMNTWLSMFQFRLVFSTFKVLALFGLSIAGFETRMKILMPLFFNQKWLDQNDNQKKMFEKCRKILQMEEDFCFWGSGKQFVGLATFFRLKSTYMKVYKDYNRLLFNSNDGRIDNRNCGWAKNTSIQPPKVMIISGRHDQILSPKNANELKKMYRKNAILKRFEGGGHVINIQYPQRISKCIFDFFENEMNK